MSEAKPRKEMTQLEQYKAWKDWWKTADTFYARAAQFAITMEHDPESWIIKRKYYKKMLKYANQYEEERKDELGWEEFCKWDQERKQKKWDKKSKNEAITEEDNN